MLPQYIGFPYHLGCATLYDGRCTEGRGARKMMTYSEARSFQARLTADTRHFTRMRKADLVAFRREQLEAEGVIWESGGPASKDELVNDILNRRYPLAQVNETSHVLYHAPSSRWAACDHCQARPSTTTVRTGELMPGDVVVEHGMRVRIDEVREYRPDGASSEQRAWSCPGTVLNVDDVTAQHVIPASFLEIYGYREGEGWVVERRDAWTVQGNALAVWLVELPRPAASQQTGCSTPGLHATGRCVCMGITWTDTAAAERAAADRQAAQ